MELFGFGTPSELATPFGQLIKHATDNLRLVPDWTKNLEICDAINRRLENNEAAVKAILRRLQDSNQQTVYLSLILLETCMKNCGTNFAASFDRPLMEEVVKIAKGSKGIKNSDEALRLIQQWGRVFESRRAVYPLFFDTFVGLKSKGVLFPKEEENPISGYDLDPLPPQASKRSTGASRPPTSPQTVPAPAPAPAARRDDEDDFFRLQRDLFSVLEKVKLCREMLLVSPGIEQDEALADVIGFLEACRDRMVDVIESGTQGLLGEELFSQCLKVNDAILRTLEAERTGVKISVEDDEGEGKASDNGEKKSSSDLLNLDSDNAPVVAPVKASTLVDDLIFASKPSASVVTNPADDPFNPSFGVQPKANTAGAPVLAPAAAPAFVPLQRPAPAVFSSPVSQTILPAAAAPAIPAKAPLLPPQPPASVPSSNSAAQKQNTDPFENNPFADAPDPPLPAPPASATTIAATSLDKKVDDFDIFLQESAALPAATTTPSTAGVAAPAPPAVEEDFDAFLASLDKK